MPPELVGAHVGPTRAHTTGRTHDISFRAITAQFAHVGMEWDIRHAHPTDLATLRRAIALYKSHRGLIHSGIRVNADLGEPNLSLHGVVSHDGAEGLFAAVALGTLATETPGRIGVPGLAPGLEYRVEAILPTPQDSDWEDTFTQISPPSWLAQGSATASGRFLSEIGLALPMLRPEHALALRVTAFD